MDITEIERRVDRAIAAPMPLDAPGGGLIPQTMGEAMEVSKLMAIAGPVVPKFMRGNVGTCLAISLQAYRWQMDPFAVASKCYMVINKGEERVAYEAQLIHAVVTTRAPLKSRLRMEIRGEGDDRRCHVSGHFRGEESPHTYLSETLGKLRDARGRNEYGNIKGSPLWDTNPEVQLTYSAVRQWARLHASETLLGVYTPDELDDGSQIKDITPPPVSDLTERLRAAKKAHVKGDRGFDAEHVAREVSLNSIIEGDANPGVDQEVTKNDDVKGSSDATGVEGGQDAVGGGDGNVVHQDGSDGTVGADQALVGGTAGPSAEGEDEAKVFPPDRISSGPQPKGKGKR